MMADDDDFAALLDGYLEPPKDLNPKMVGVQLEWVRGNPKYGSLHMQQKHGVSEQEVYEVLFLIPPYAETKRHPKLMGRRLFWGATQNDRKLFVVCEDASIKGRRILKPVTAFPPEKEEEYWRSLK